MIRKWEVKGGTSDTNRAAKHHIRSSKHFQVITVKKSDTRGRSIRRREIFGNHKWNISWYGFLSPTLLDCIIRWKKSGVNTLKLNYGGRVTKTVENRGEVRDTRRSSTNTREKRNNYQQEGNKTKVPVHALHKSRGRGIGGREDTNKRRKWIYPSFMKKGAEVHAFGSGMPQSGEKKLKEGKLALNGTCFIVSE